LRIERAGGRYHATARGNERRNIFRGETDRFHFLKQTIKTIERTLLNAEM
jgi:REP element-mobilizing transposase RayT